MGSFHLQFGTVPTHHLPLQTKCRSAVISHSSLHFEVVVHCSPPNTHHHRHPCADQPLAPITISPPHHKITNATSNSFHVFSCYLDSCMMMNSLLYVLLPRQLLHIFFKLPNPLLVFCVLSLVLGKPTVILMPMQAQLETCKNSLVL